MTDSDRLAGDKAARDDPRIRKMAHTTSAIHVPFIIMVSMIINGAAYLVCLALYPDYYITNHLPLTVFLTAAFFLNDYKDSLKKARTLKEMKENKFTITYEGGDDYLITGIITRAKTQIEYRELMHEREFNAFEQL